jgi:excinuclease ABC subunit B
VFDVLVGINLLREGLDMPEVSLVAILDADKEGFLRSTRSLIQTIGRAARHINGRAILYADRITDSMKRAIDETERRRTIQAQHNLDNGIVPQSLNKKITDIMDLGEQASVQEDKATYGKKSAKQTTEILSTNEIGSQIKQLENEMHAFARELEFEKAAQVRDKIQQLHQALIKA